MTTRAGKRSSLLFARFLSIIAALFFWQLTVSCAEGGGTGLVEQSSGDASWAQDAGLGGQTGFCGDGQINVASEQCDGINLDGETCTSLGMGTGTLSCDQSCIFDTTMCSPATEVTAGAGGGSSYGGSGGAAGGN